MSLGKDPRGNAMSRSTGSAVVMSVVGESPSDVNNRNVGRYIARVDTIGAPDAMFENRCVILPVVLHRGRLSLEPRAALGDEVHVICKQRSKRIHVVSVPASLPLLGPALQRL